MVDKTRESPTEPSINHTTLQCEDVSSRLKRMYSIVNRKKTGAESAYGGDKVTPIAGEITKGSMIRVVKIMEDKMSFNSNSRVLDIGCGQGKPSLHFATAVNPSFNFGVEVVPWRWYQATTNLMKVFDDSVTGGAPFPNCFFQLGNIRQARTLDPFTHIYMFSTG